MFGFINSAFKVLILVFLLALPLKYWLWLRGQDEAFRDFRATLFAASVATSLSTSFARVDAFRALDKEGHWNPVNSFGAAADPQSVDLEQLRAFCSRTYDVTIGYPAFRARAQKAAQTGGELPMPQVLSVNTVSATNWGKDSSKECLQRFDGDSLTSTVKDALVTDGSWELHTRNGLAMLVDASRRALPQCTPNKPCGLDELRRKRDALFALDETKFRLVSRCFGEPEGRESSAACEAARAYARGTAAAMARTDFPKGENSEFLYNQALHPSTDPSAGPRVLGPDGTGGYEGTVVLTMSALATMGNEKRVTLAWIIPLWKKEAFYFRREIAEITFGSYVSANPVRKSLRAIFGGSSLTFHVSDPAVVSINRRVSAQGYSGDSSLLESGGRSLTTEANDGIQKALDAAVKRYTPASQVVSRRILRARYESDELEIAFDKEKDASHVTTFLAGE